MGQRMSGHHSVFHDCISCPCGFLTAIIGALLIVPIFAMAILTPAAKPASVVTFRRRGVRLVALLFCFVLVGCKQLGGGGGGGGKNLTSPVTGLTATSGNAEVTLTWTPYPGADSYDVKRSNTSGGPYSYLNQNFLIPTTSASYTDAGLTNGTTY